MGKASADKEIKRRRVGTEAADPPVDAVDEGSQAADHQKDSQVSFQSADEIRRALDTANTDLLIQGFTHLREHLKICNRAVGDGAPVEARALREACRRVVYEWADESSGFEEVAAAWQLAQKHGVARLEALIPGTVGRLLETLDAAETFVHGRRLIRMVLDGFMKAVHRAFGTPRSSACASALQLLCQMVAFARGEHADELRLAFDWTMKALDELPAIRPTVVGFSIRRLWIRFVMAFFAADRCQASVELLRTRRLISNLFRGVEKDSYQELHALLSSVYTHIVLNTSISRADKRRVFGVSLMGSLAKAAHNTAPVAPQEVGVSCPATFAPKAASPDDEPAMTSDSVSALVIRFFRGMMTHPGHGICYHQHGLYPAPHRLQGGAAAAAAADAEDMQDVATFTKASTSAEMHELCNSLILRILVTCINPQGSRRMADLAVDILRASPELIAPFWRNYRCALEPQLSLRYLGSTAFAMKVMALPLPVSPGPAAIPRLNTLIEHVTPFALARSALGRGLQMRTSPLVRYRTLLLVDMALRKLGAARAWIQAQAAGGSGGGNSSAAGWRLLDQRLVAAVKQRVPEWKLVVLVHHDLSTAAQTPAPAMELQDSGDLRELECQHAVLGNVLMRVMGGYQMHFGELVLESHFELGKLITSVQLSDVVAVGELNSQRVRNPVGAHTLQYLLNALAATPAASVNWMARVRPEESHDAVQHTGLGVVLVVYLFAVQPELRRAARRASVAALQSTGLFDHDTGPAETSEVACWLDSLAALTSPHANRSTRLSFIPSGRLALGHSLVAFLEDAAGYAAKQPYKYADRICAPDSDAEEGVQLPFSPLLSAVVEAAVLKAATGNGTLAALLRESPAARVASEMQTNTMFAYIREVMCRIAEMRGQRAARHLQPFIATAATAVLAPRAAKLATAKDHDKTEAERKHYAKVEAAFASAYADVREYLAVLCAPAAQPAGAGTGALATAAAAKLPSAVAKRLKRDLASTCADVEARLAAFTAVLIDAVHQIGSSSSSSSSSSSKGHDARPTAAITRWLLQRAKKMTGGERQAAFVVAITWISQHDRVSLPGQSLWDHPLFVELAPEIMQIDDLAFLEALYRHLLMSRNPGALLSNAGVQRLLAHMMVSQRGSVLFCDIASRLAQLVASGCFADSGEGHQAASFVCSLISRHMASMAPGPEAGEQERASCTRALENYASALGQPLLGDDTDLQQLFSYSAAVLVHRTAEEWLSPQEAARIWGPFAARVEASASSMCNPDGMAGTDGTRAVYLLLLLRHVSAALSGRTRVRLVRDLGAAASSELPIGTYCAVATTALVLLRGIASGAGEGRREAEAIGEMFTARVISLWAESLGTQGADAEAALEDAARQVTATMGPALSRHADRDGALVTDIRNRVALVRAQLPRFGGRHLSGASVDVAAVLEHMWHNAKSSRGYAADATRRLLLARIMSLNLPALASACGWAQRAMDSGRLTATRGRLVAWLLSTVVAECTATDEYGRVVWDDDAHSSALRVRCLALAQRLFGGATAPIGSVAADEGTLLLATSFVQGAEDNVAVAAFCDAVSKDIEDPLSPARVALLESRVLRCAAHPGRPEAVAEAVLELMELGKRAVPPLASLGGPPDASRWRAVSILASAAELCQQELAHRATVDAEKCVRCVADSVSSMLASICQPFEQGADMSDAEVAKAASCYPPAVFRLVAYAVQTADSICAASALVPSATHGWFAALRGLLGCRLFNARAYASETRDLVAMTVLGLWRLSRPSLSRWSASLDDYLTLDELESLVGAYSGSSTLADRALLQVIQEYESTTRQSVQRAALVFGPVAAGIYVKERVGRIRYLIERDENAVGVVGEETVAAALAAIDSSRMHRTVVDFPIAAKDLNFGGGDGAPSQLPRMLARAAGSPGAGQDAPEHAQAYDPQFILPWVWTIVSCGQGVDLRRVIESHAAGVAVAALSASSAQVRKLAYYTLDTLYARIPEAQSLSGKRQCILLLDALRNGITGRTATEFPRIPFPLALFAATSLNTMIHPEHIMFGNVNRLLLKRPFLRPGGVPLLRVILRSSAETRGHRAHILTQACQAARAFSQCPAAFRRCDLVNLVLALSTSALGDAQAAGAALTMLFHLTSAANADILTEYVSKGRFSLLAWIRGQVSLEAGSLRAAANQATAERVRGGGGGSGVSPATMQLLLAAIANLTALARLVVRAAANFPPARLGSGTLAYNRFWAITSSTQPNAPGQTAAMCVFQQALDAAAGAVSALGDTANTRQAAVAALALARTCVDGARLLADIQRTCGCDESFALQPPHIARCALAIVRLAEPVVEREAAAGCEGGAFVVRFDPCAIAAIAGAQHPASLFATEATLGGTGGTALDRPSRGALGLYSCYRSSIDGLFAWITVAPPSDIHASELMEIVSRALVVGAPAAAKAVAWMRDCHDEQTAASS